MKPERLGVSDVPDLNEVRLRARAYRALGWGYRWDDEKAEPYLVRLADPDRSRVNGTSLQEKLEVAYLLVEARLKGEHPRGYVRERLPGGVLANPYSTVGRKIKVARDFLATEPEWEPQLEQIARERLST